MTLPMTLPVAAPVADAPAENVEQQTNRLARTYADHPNVAFCNFPAVRMVVRKAVASRRFTDDEIIAALARLASDGRGVTTDTLRIELTGVPAQRRPGQQQRLTPAEIAAVNW